MSLRPLTSDDVDRLKAITGRECGACSLCCKLAAIEELNKPANAWCTHCKPGQGCSIYTERPTPCRDFACDWLTDPYVPDYWRPISSHMILTRVTSGDQLILRVMVDANYADLWKREPYLPHLVTLARKGLAENRFAVHVLVGRRTWLIRPDGIRDLGPQGA